MKKRILSILLCFCMAISLLPMSALAVETQTICGLTITQTSGSGGVTINSNGTSVGMISIKQAGSYTISGTYSGGEANEKAWRQAQSIWRGIIDVTGATGNVELTLDNVSISTSNDENMPIMISRTNNGSANVTINLVGVNTLVAIGNAIPQTSDMRGSGAIVKQGGSGSLTFTGSGSLNAQASGVAIGSPYMSTSLTEKQPYNCSNITFAQTGTITATTTDAMSSCVGAVAGYTGGGSTPLSATVSNITVQSGTLNLVNTATDPLRGGALLGCAYWTEKSAYYRDISVTGGKITTNISSTPDSDYYAIGGGTVISGHKGVKVTGGTIVSASGLTFKAYDARSGVSGFAYGTYIAASDAVSSLSVKVNGTDYPYTAGGVEAQSGKVWLYLPVGDVAITLNGTQYYGTVDSSGSTELKQAFNPVTGITGLPTAMSANSTITLAGVVAPADATFTSISKYEILDAGTTGATLSGNKLTALGAGTVNLRATVGSGLGTSDYTKDFEVAVSFTPLTNIDGIPASIQNGVAVTLTPGFTPSDASYRDVVWSVKSGSATVNGNSVTPTAPCTLVLTATVANGTAYGTNYTKDFTITVPSEPVTDITASIPSTLTINEELSLSGTVTPSNASYQTIVWSVTDAGATGAAITNGKLKATDAGTLTLLATVANGVSEGVDFTRNYTIQVLGAGSVLDISVGPITITSKDTNTNTVTYSGYTDGSKDVPKSETIVIKGSYSGTATRITVNGTTAVMLLQGVTMSNTGGAADGKNCISLASGASLTLSSAGSNTISTNGSGDAATIHVPSGTTLTIEDGGGSLNITSGNGAAIGGNCGRSGNGEDGGTVVINGGTVNASSDSYGAGIGGGGSLSAGCIGGASGSVTINGGIVSASSSQGAGIGGGLSVGTGGAGGSVNITGGVVTAAGGYYSAGIGGGGANSATASGGVGGTVAISGGTVTVTSAYSGTMAIGGGKNSSTVAGNGTLTITGGSVTTNRSITGGTSGSNTCVAATNGSTPVYRTTVDLSDTVGVNKALAGASSIGGLTYGFNDVTTDDSGKIYLYLPENSSRTATLNGEPGYTGSTIADDTGILSLSGLTATLQLGTPYLTDNGAAVLVTPSLAGTVYYMAVKNGAADLYTDADALKNASGIKSASVTANTALMLTGMTALEGDYTVYAALISSSGTYKSAVMTGTLSVPAEAPDSADVIIDYSAETLKAATGLAYSLQYFVTAEATTGGTAIITGGVSVTSLINSTVYVRKVFADESVGGAALAVTFLPRPDAPAVPSCTVAATSITVAAESGAEYSIDGTSWNTTGSFTGLTAVKNYTVYSRIKATSSTFASESVSAIVSTVAAVNAPTKEGAGAAFTGNAISADKATVGAGASVTYTITAISGYTPSLSINSGAVTLTDEGNGTYTYNYTSEEGIESISAVATFEGVVIDHIVADSVTLFADDARNESQAMLSAYLDTLTVTAKDSSDNTLGTLDAAYVLSSGTFVATGGSYTFTATAGGKTCDVAVTIKAVNATVAPVSDITKMVRPADGYTTYSAIGLPETATVTYTGDGYTQKTESRSVTWGPIPTNFGKTATTLNFTGSVSLPLWAIGSNILALNVTINPKNSANVTVTQANGIYGEALADPQIAVTDKDGASLTDTTKLTISYSGTTGTRTAYGPSEDKPAQPGTYTVTVTYEDEANSGTGSVEFSIKEAISGNVSIALDNDADGNGIADAGDTLKVAGVTPSGATLTYVWKLNGAEAGTGSSYTVGTGDAGKRITATISGSGYYTGTLTSAEYKIGARTLSGTIAISGNTTAGSTVTAAFSATSGTPVMGNDYHIQWYRISGGTTTVITGANALTYTLTNSDLGKTLKVTLIADISDSAYTGTVSQTTDIPAVLPDTPVITASAGSGNVTLSWSAPFDGGSQLTRYKLYYKSGSDAYSAAIEIAADALSYEVTSLSNDTAYTFKLEAINILGTAESAEVTATPAAQSSGGSPSGGGTASPTTGITVRVSTGKGYVEAAVNVKDSTATISMTDTQIKEIASGAEITGTIQIDVSGLKVNAAVVPSTLVSAIGAASGSTGLAVALPGGTVTLDKAALASVVGKGDMKFSVDNVDNSKLTEAQKSALGNQSSTALVVDVNVFVSGTQTSTFGDGRITVSVPYTPKSGENTDSITVWFMKDDGIVEPKNGVYNADTSCVEFTTEHLSQYLIVSFPFADVAEDAWYYGNVAYAYNNGLFAGTSDTTFSPNIAMTRQMIWMVLARMDDKTPADMDAARAWAMENGISDGSNPTNSITREQMAAILYRYAQYKGYDTTQGGMAIREFADYDSISEYALTALGWSVNAGLMQGSDNNLMPAGSATRAQVATILQRFCQNVAK